MAAPARTRITAGDWRGRLIDTPRGLGVRPTRSMVREALFNVLGDRVVGASCIDLYAGAGTLGFEALSRGAARVTFVDRDRAALAAISATAGRLGCSERCALVRGDALAWVRRTPESAATAGVCFVDAPYRDAGLDRVLEELGQSPPALVVCEHHHERRLPTRIGGLALVRDVRHGINTLSFLQRISSDAPEPH
ncbi:MAG: 16S rRNA (guanine(966)-N(2))-methyltransferase RsmD [Candidatus Dormibacteraeota bacterium]|nr:16S rRNA (guanine(966)-N(2))-methyltransferase RsmD [Candidatus Dormibacteraeota bacterium]MBV9524284.1 16S rRNA (guanine(966)-N(2))-methyltransferase RsmD [Candidatus Dormibacteraeota bacterium]